MLHHDNFRKANAKSPHWETRSNGIVDVDEKMLDVEGFR